MGKVGKFFKCFLPMILLLVVQVVAALVLSIVGVSDMMTILTVYEVIALIILVIWYVLGKHKVSQRTKKLSGTSIVYILVWFVALEMLASACMYAVQDIFPSLMENYADMIATSGIADFTVLSIIMTLLGAPVLEELAFRGLTMEFAGKLSKKFWVANFIQALLFGIMHMNIVQGTYAFFMGLALGYIAKKYKSLVASMIGHFAFNFSGTFLVALLYGTEEDVAPLKLAIVAAVSVIFFVLVFIFIKKDEKTDVDGIEETVLS